MKNPFKYLFRKRPKEIPAPPAKEILLEMGEVVVKDKYGWIAIKQRQ